MICDKTFKKFHLYFTTAYNFGFIFFKWNNKRRLFHTKTPIADWQISLWLFNNLILVLKTFFLLIQVYNLKQTGQTSKLFFENSFMILFFLAFMHNLLYLRSETGIPVLYWRCVTFSNASCSKYLSRRNKRYPVDDDGLSGMIRETICINFVLTFCVFALSIGDPTFPLFFASWFSQGAQTYITDHIWLRLILSTFEACITLFAWTSCSSIILFVSNFCVLFTFWCKELHSACANFSKRTFSETVSLYRQLHCLIGLFNECFASQMQILFICAFINQVCVNYGTIKLYNELSFLSWVALPYLAVFGALNIVTVHKFLANPFERSNAAFQSWMLPECVGKSSKERQYKSRQRIVVSCSSLKLKYGTLKFLRKDDGIEWLDSLIDSTVTALLW